MPTRPGMMVWLWRSMIWIWFGALLFVGGVAEMLVILPFSMRRDWSSRGAAPVPSMMRTWVRRIAGALTLTYLETAGERVWAWSVAGRVVAAVVRDRARIAVRAKLGRMNFSVWSEFTPDGG